MKKIGILTFHGADNLGAVLQAYALCEFIDKEINFRTEIIDYECEEVEKTRYVQGGNFVKKIPLALYYRIKRHSFDRFRKKNLMLSSNKYKKENIKKTNAEISIGRFIDCDENGKANANSEKCKEEIKVLACKDAIESLLIDNGWVTSHACNKLFKKELFDSLEFPVGKVYEDSFVIIDLLLKAKTVVSDAHGIYRYCHRKGSIVETKFTEKNMDLLEAWEKNKNQIIEYFPELNKEVEFRYLWVCCYLYDKCMLNENRCDQEQELRKILKNNFVDILKNPYFRMTRKIALCVLRVSTAAYRESVRRKLSVID